MADAADVRRIAFGLEGTTEAPHFDRTAFKARRIYATLAADGLSANLRLPLEEQDFRCTVLPDAFSPVPNAWGKQGWTTIRLGALEPPDLESALRAAWRHAVEKPPKRR